MGSLGTFFATMLVAVTYGWMPASSDGTGESASSSNGYEYLVQVGPEDLRALAEGRVSSLSSATPEGMKSIDRVRIVFGEGTLPRQLTAVDRTSPKRLSQTASSQERHAVAKPIVSDWLPARGEEAGTETGQRHTVYQRPGYQNPGSLGDAMQRGFQEGTRQLTDTLRNAPQNVGDYTNQSVRDVAQGTRGVVEGALGGLNDSVRAGADGLRNSANNAVNLGNKPYFDRRQQEQNPQRSQTNGTTAGAQQQGFTPFSYEKQPTLADSQNSHAGHDHAGHDHAGHNHQPSPNLDRQPADNRNQGPALPPASGRQATDSGIAKQFGSGANDDPGYRRNEADRVYNNDYRNNDYRNDDRRNDVDRNSDRDPYVNRRDEGRMTPVARDSNLRGPLDDFGTRRDDTYRNPARSAFDDWRTPTADTRRPAAPDFSTPNSWDTPPLNPQQPVNQTAGFGTPNPNQGTSPEVAPWGGGGTNTNNNANANSNGSFANNGVNNGVNNGANNGGQQSASLGNDLWLYVLLAGSVFGNLYVVTSYLDVRNKYRSALRQGPSGYRNAA